jgi:hypothetical protein
VAQPVQAHLDRAVRQAKAPGDRLLRQVLGVAQVQQLAVGLVEARDRGMEVGPLDGRDDLLVLGALRRLDLGDGIRTPASVLAEGLVADDRRQPLLATTRVAQRRASSPSPQQRVLSDVLGFSRVARVAEGEANAEPLRLVPVPAVVGPRFFGWRKFD